MPDGRRRCRRVDGGASRSASPRDEYDAGRREARPRAQPGRAGDVLAAVERALRLQALEEAAAHAADRGRARARRARARTPAPSTPATGWRARSRSSRTTTRARSSPSRAPRPASAGSCATSSRSARGPSRCSTRCASASRRRASARATCSTARSAGIGHYGNSIGVPTIGGEVYFEGPYEQNCLVNAMALGLAERDAARAQRRGRRRQRRRPLRRLDRPRRDRRRVGARVRRARRGRRGQAPDRAGRRPVRGEKLSSARSSCSSAG